MMMKRTREDTRLTSGLRTIRVRADEENYVKGSIRGLHFMFYLRLKKSQFSALQQQQQQNIWRPENEHA